MNAVKVVKRNYQVFWRGWRGSMFLSVLGPVMFLSAMGMGLGSLVRTPSDGFGGVEYLAFFATGMLAAQAMQTGSFSAAWPLLSKFLWRKTYDPMLSTPLSVRDLFFGELIWIGLLLVQQVVPFFVIMVLFDIVEPSMALSAIPVAVLLGLSCAAALMAYTATMETDKPYAWVFRFVMTPLFLLSGTFFPVEELPAWAEVVAQLTPLYHGIDLIRQLTIWEFSLGSAVAHLVYLVVFLAIGVTFGLRNFERRLVV